MDFRILGPLEAVGEVASSRWTRRSRVPFWRSCSCTRTSPWGATGLSRILGRSSAGHRARRSLQNYVCQLRKALGNEAIVTRPAGYEPRVEPGGLDLHRFERLVSGARGAEPRVRSPRACERRSRSGAARRSSSSPTSPGRRGSSVGWRSFTCPRSRIGSTRTLLSAATGNSSASATPGRRAPAVGATARSVHARPLPLRRQAEALAAYRAARETLVETLGIEPGVALRRLERAILVQDPAPAASPAGPGRGCRACGGSDLLRRP